MTVTTLTAVALAVLTVALSAFISSREQSVLRPVRVRHNDVRRRVRR